MEPMTPYARAPDPLSCYAPQYPSLYLPPPGAASLPPTQQQPHLAPPPHLPTPMQPPTPQQNPMTPLYVTYSSFQLPRDEVRTLFIGGLPDDVKPREVYNLFREFPGYESFQLKNTGRSSKAIAFAVFSDQQSAVGAMHALNGMIFDLEKETELCINLAKANSWSKRTRSDDGMTGSSDKKARGLGSFVTGLLDSGDGRIIHMPGMVNSANNVNGYPSAQSQGNFHLEAGFDKNPKMSLNNSSKPYIHQNNDPCPTLFVANLGPNCTEEVLTQIFSRCPGFLKLKMQNKLGIPVAFVDFQDTASSTVALRFLQGSTDFSLHGEGMRIEYAKSRMGMRKRERKS